jgi:hypothetical protein
MANSISLSFRNIPTFLSALDGQLLDFDPRRNLAEVELVVPVGYHDIYYCRESKAYKESDSYSTTVMDALGRNRVSH